ncbi:MAG: PQQ-dependent sugar dehydrogenase [Bryobacterales bacterium]|nr:PQQ-dependent sugar dehydrogenase [Bryobacterales bacterium]MBV9396576.1 PQQ-dependent sugar dehydrogenase [Bryobacterales bacterium]
MKFHPLSSIVSVLSFAVTLNIFAQQPVAPGRGGGKAPTAPPPINWPSPPLPDGPIVLDTAIQRQVRLFVTKGLNQPWSMAFLPDGAILVTERPGRLRIVRNGVLDPNPVAGVPEVRAQGLAGLMDLALHPRFTENKLIYFTYHKPAGGGGPGNSAGVITLARGRWDGGGLTEVRDIFSAIPNANASRIIFGRDGMIYMSVGVGDPPAAARAQDPNDLAGKVLRLRDDGTVPPDNPFVGRAGYRPEIYTLGHRNPLGLAVHPETGSIWECEDGPNGGDEINILQPGKNYGWPVVSFGRFYLGPRVSENPWHEGMELPTVYWVPAIAISGMTFYTGDKFPNWKNHVFVGGMRQGEVPRSGHLERIDFNDKWEELHRESMLRELQNRIRDVRQGPDGYLYLLTAENDGALIRMEPYNATAQQGER